MPAAAFDLTVTINSPIFATCPFSLSELRTGDDNPEFKGQIGPLVGVWFDDESLQKLKDMYPEADAARLRKAVIEYNPSHVDRARYEALYGQDVDVEASLMRNTSMVFRSVTSAGHRVILLWYMQSTTRADFRQGVNGNLLASPGWELEARV